MKTKSFSEALGSVSGTLHVIETDPRCQDDPHLATALAAG